MDERIRKLTEMFQAREWFHSVGVDQYGRPVVYVNFMCNETLHDIPVTVDNKQVLIYFASSLLATREQFTSNGKEKLKEVQSEADLLARDMNFLIKDLGKIKIRDIFYEIHDGPNALTQLSDRHLYARDCLEKLYDEYGFDVLFDLLDNDE